MERVKMRSNSRQTIKVNKCEKMREKTRAPAAIADGQKTPAVIIVMCTESGKMGIRSAVTDCAPFHANARAACCLYIGGCWTRECIWEAMNIIFDIMLATNGDAIAPCARSSHMRFVRCVSIVFCCCWVASFLARFCAFSINLCNLFWVVYFLCPTMGSGYA